MSVVDSPATEGTSTKLIALAGNPNSGKTTLFNYLTGLQHKVGNYPGVTVEHREGAMSGTERIRLLDLPGCYSLRPRSLDERIARDALLGWAEGVRRPDGVIVIVDASNLERNLFLASQILDLNIPTVIVCNMMDIVRARGDSLDLEKLGGMLDATVVGTTGSTGEGMDSLRAALHDLDQCRVRDTEWKGSPELESSIVQIEQLLTEHNLVQGISRRAVARLLLCASESDVDKMVNRDLPGTCRETLATIRSKHVGNGTTPPAAEVVQARYRRLGEIVSAVANRPPDPDGDLTDRLDRILTHKVWGLATFSGVMMLMFLALFSGAGPLMNGIDWVIAHAGVVIGGALGDGMLRDLLVDGVIAGVGAIVVFFPQICILFLFVAVLEDSGYMARVAFVMDRIMSGAGLHGKSFIPLLSSYACAVPGIMSTRTIENRRDRMTTMLVAPLMSCSARLPIYIILISALFGTSVWLKAGIMFAMYAVGTVTALLMAMLFKRTLFKGPTPTFIMELPPYRKPKIGSVLRNMWNQSKLFLTQAGTIILAMSIVLWALAYFPRTPDGAVAEKGAQLRQSYMGRIGQVIEPVIEPLGFDWKIGVGLASSFAAREVFVATMGVVYGVGDGANEKSVPLREQIAKATWPDGRKVFTPLVGISLMIFYVLACQCMSTLAVVRRETGSWRWPAFMFTYMAVLAYTGSFIVYQGGTALGWG